jgi:hypothetical protein
MYSRSAKGGEKGDLNRNPWLAKMVKNIPPKKIKVALLCLQNYTLSKNKDIALNNCLVEEL